jgi:radical SAM family uncharacterized protein/radical SAM-linked protein
MTNKNKFQEAALDELLQQVQKPGRYTGGEWNAVHKDPRSVEMKIALAFPDVYEVGMSYLGQKILYHILNRSPAFLAERVFAPWPDFEQVLRNGDVPLFSLENHIPLHEFDIVGFSLLYELNYSNVLTILDLGRIPLLSADRTDEFPIVMAGGPAAFNPEPVAEIFDLFLIGDGEQAFPEIVEVCRKLISRGESRDQVLNRLAELPGVYVPSKYDTYSPSNSPLLAVRPRAAAQAVIEKRVCLPFSQAPFPEDIIVPNIQIIHDRAVVEVERGCPQNCRFCQARNIYFPARPKDPKFVYDRLLNSVRSTGYEDASLAALSVGDYPYLEDLITRLMVELKKSQVGLSLPSLRPGGLTPEVVEQILQVRKTGFTLVPEAGSERMRRVINKHIKNQDLREAAENAFKNGWQKLKLYFMVGLPTETSEDVEGIADLVQEMLRLGQSILNRAPHINLSVSAFIPKPHTPFQWVAMEDMESLRKKYAMLKERLKKYRTVRFKEHGLNGSVLEAVFSRGDRRLSGVLIEAWKAGARFDSWTEHFFWPVWKQAFENQGIDTHRYLGELDRNAPLPWDHIHTGVKKKYLLRELDQAQAAKPTPACEPRLCRDCQGCTVGFPKERISALPSESEGPAVFELFTQKSPDILRYRVCYAKKGRARYISHNDLVNLFQRTFRRSGIPIEFSQGFHPKMRMSFAPALALGMTGREEIMEFRSSQVIPEDLFLEAVNTKLPEGVCILTLKRLDASDLTLSEALSGIVYSIELNRGEVSRFLDQLRHLPQYQNVSHRELTERLVQDYFSSAALDVQELVLLTQDKNRLLISIRLSPGKSPRPQDIVAELFDLSHPAFSLIREHLILDPAH